MKKKGVPGSGFPINAMAFNNTPASPNISTKTAGWVIGFSSLSHSLTAGHQYLGNTILPGEVLQWNFLELPGFSLC